MSTDINDAWYPSNAVEIFDFAFVVKMTWISVGEPGDDEASAAIASKPCRKESPATRWRREGPGEAGPDHGAVAATRAVRAASSQAASQRRIVMSTRPGVYRRARSAMMADDLSTAANRLDRAGVAIRREGSH